MKNIILHNTKSCLRLSALLLMFVMPLFAIQAQDVTKTIGINAAKYGREGNYGGGNWNCFYSSIDGTHAINSIDKLVDMNGDTTDIGLTLPTLFYNHYHRGVKGIESLGFPDSVAITYHYGKGNQNPELVFTNLNSSTEYSYEILTGIADGTDTLVRETKFIIIGDYNDTAIVNTPDTAIVSGKCKPASDNTITISISAGDSCNSGTHYFYLNGMRLTYTDISTSIEAEDATKQCMVYPNPAQDRVTIEVAEVSQMKIYNLSGKMVQDAMLQAGVNELPLDLSAGIYTIQVIGANDNITTNKLVVE